MILALIHPLVFIIGGVALLLWAGIIMAVAVMAGRADDEAEAERRRLPAARRPCEGRRQHERYL